LRAREQQSLLESPFYPLRGMMCCHVAMLCHVVICVLSSLTLSAPKEIFVFRCFFISLGRLVVAWRHCLYAAHWDGWWKKVSSTFGLLARRPKYFGALQGAAKYILYFFFKNCHRQTIQKTESQFSHSLKRLYFEGNGLNK